MTHRLDALLSWGRRYLSGTLIVALGAIAFVVFLNDNSLMRTYELERQIESLQAEIRQHTDTLAHYQRLNERLETDAATMERIVRENYHMQRPGEDIYLTDTPR